MPDYLREFGNATPNLGCTPNVMRSRDISMKTLIRLLRGFANIWFVLAGIFIVGNLILVWYYEGFSRVQEIMSPFNVWNFIMMIITLSPGLGALFLADHLEKKKRLENPIGKN